MYLFHLVLFVVLTSLLIWKKHAYFINHIKWFTFKSKKIIWLSVKSKFLIIFWLYFSLFSLRIQPFEFNSVLKWITVHWNRRYQKELDKLTFPLFLYKVIKQRNLKSNWSGNNKYIYILFNTCWNAYYFSIINILIIILINKYQILNEVCVYIILLHTLVVYILKHI